MSEATGIIRRGRGRFDDVNSLDAVSRPFLQRAGGRKFGRRLRERAEERQAIAVLVAEEFEAQEEIDPPVDPQKGFLARLVDWLADPANQAKLLAIIEFFMGLIDQFFPAPVSMAAEAATNEGTSILHMELLEARRQFDAAIASLSSAMEFVR